MVKKKPSQEIYDALIIGAGPAGSEMAFRLAKAGFKVAVLEKDRLDREKPCGGGIQLKELLEFGSLPERVIERKIRKARIYSPYNSMIETGMKNSGHNKQKSLFAATVRRGVYDRHLQEKAVKAGARFLEKRNVTGIRREKGLLMVKAGKETFPARLAVDAAGAASNITRMLGIKDRAGELCLTTEAWLRVKDIDSMFRDSIEFYFLRSLPEGYAWIFPKKDVVSVGIGATADSLKKNKINLAKSLNDFISKHPVASKKLRNSRIVRKGGGMVPTGISPRLYSGSAVVVGDAGGFANIIHGGGIYQARKSAAIASQHCIRFLRTGRQEHLQEYDRRAREFFNDYETKWDRRIRNVMWNQDAMEAFVKKGKEDESIKKALGIVLTSARSHEKAYNIMESRMLDIIYSEMDSRTGKHKKAINRKLKSLFPGSETIHKQANHILLNDRAKRLRACLGILSSGIFGGNRDDAVNFSLVFELFHTASLVHDDIMDGSEKRRGRRTLHSRYGVNNAIITGDLMLSKAYSLISEFSRKGGLPRERIMALLDAAGDAGEKCCRGQSMDLQMAGKRKYSDINEYLKMIELKTGSLIEGSVKGGAIVAGASKKHIRTAGDFGRYLGMAFQIIDDSLDLLGGRRAEKSVMNDLREGKATPMIIHALANAGPQDRKAVMRAAGKRGITRKEAGRVLGIYRKYGAIHFTQKLSRKYINKARKSLAMLPACRQRDELEGILSILGYWSILGSE